VNISSINQSLGKNENTSVAQHRMPAAKSSISLLLHVGRVVINSQFALIAAVMISDDLITFNKQLLMNLL